MTSQNIDFRTGTLCIFYMIKSYKTEKTNLGEMLLVLDNKLYY